MESARTGQSDCEVSRDGGGLELGPQYLVADDRCVTLLDADTPFFGLANHLVGLSLVTDVASDGLRLPAHAGEDIPGSDPRPCVWWRDSLGDWYAATCLVDQVERQPSVLWSVAKQDHVTGAGAPWLSAADWPTAMRDFRATVLDSITEVEGLRRMAADVSDRAASAHNLVCLWGTGVFTPAEADLLASAIDLLNAACDPGRAAAASGSASRAAEGVLGAQGRLAASCRRLVTAGLTRVVAG